MQLLCLRKDYLRGYAIPSYELSLVFVVDGVERYKDSITIPSADFHAFTHDSNADPRVKRAATAIGITPWLLQTMVMLMNRYAEWEVKDGDAIELDDCPYLHSQPLSIPCWS